MNAKEKANVRRYFLELADHYRRNGFLAAACVVYMKFDRKSAKEIYNVLAQSALLAGIYDLSMTAYAMAGNRNMARKVKRHTGQHASGVFSVFRSRSTGFGKLFFSTTLYEREGRFEKARKYWQKAGRHCEMSGDKKLAIVYYFKAGDLESAKSLWRHLSPKVLYN